MESHDPLKECHAPEGNRPSPAVNSRVANRQHLLLDMHPVRVAERIRSHARDPKCAYSPAQAVADAEWNLLAWRFLYDDPTHAPHTRKRLALLEAADACDQLGEHREASDLRDWARSCDQGGAGAEVPE